MIVRENLYIQREAKYAGKIVDIMCTFTYKQEPLIPVPAGMLAMMGRVNGTSKSTVQILMFEDLNNKGDASVAEPHTGRFTI